MISCLETLVQPWRFLVSRLNISSTKSRETNWAQVKDRLFMDLSSILLTDVPLLFRDSPWIAITTQACSQGVNLLCREGNSQPGHWMTMKLVWLAVILSLVPRRRGTVSRSRSRETRWRIVGLTMKIKTSPDSWFFIFFFIIQALIINFGLLFMSAWPFLALSLSFARNDETTSG